MMSLYGEALELLKKQPPNMAALHELAPFLVSAFGRIPPPALGPMAFKRYWDTTYQGLVVERGSYPLSIEGCLIAYHEVYGGDPPMGINVGGWESTTDTPDTQSALTSVISADRLRSGDNNGEPRSAQISVADDTQSGRLAMNSDTFGEC
jgi:hypothetical protein